MLDFCNKVDGGIVIFMLCCDFVVVLFRRLGFRRIEELELWWRKFDCKLWGGVKIVGDFFVIRIELELILGYKLEFLFWEIFFNL